MADNLVAALSSMGMKPNIPLEEEPPKMEFNPSKVAFNILGPEGHIRLTWDRRFPQQMKEAQDKFYDLLKQGYRFFSVARDGQRSKRQILRFEPDAEDLIGEKEIVCLVPLRGG